MVRACQQSRSVSDDEKYIMKNSCYIETLIFSINAMNSGFEAGGTNTPSRIDPWSIIGDDSSISLSTDLSSCFKLNMVALRVEVLCDSQSDNKCPDGGVGFFNPGYWGMVRY